MDFSIPQKHLDGIDIQTSFESFYRQLSSNLQCSQFSRLKQRLKGLCFSYIYGYKAYQLNNLSTEELQCFKRFSKCQDIVFCKLDKGKGIVVLNKCDYVKKLNNIVSDPSKFKLLPDDPTEKRESSLQRYLRLSSAKGFSQEKSMTKLGP